MLNSLHFLTSVLIIFPDFSMTVNKSLVKSLNAMTDSLLRIKHGVADVNNEYPYVVALGHIPRGIKIPRFIKLCSGSLISPVWVLTAGHCIKDDRPTKIRYGNMTLKPKHKSATYSNVLKKFQHPAYLSYGSVKVVNDIAMLLVEPVSLNFYGRISAADHRTLVGLPVKYVGLGITVEKENLYYNDKFFNEQQTKMRQFDYAVVVPCGKMQHSNPVLCLSPKCSRRNQAAIPGDSGGPVIQTGRIIGVLILYYPSARLGFTNVATPVSPFLDWISVLMSSNT